ncbi:peroxidase 12-like [Tripterygium wilfordii]|uniref:Peroxidase n=1 Tax=Tripterygium wilfordii TaxID=458696 RepID=A0A7J7BUS9_TRIWF|nr:peroxidase 12-like [Tripterygium wilfordii]KAF5725652.1 peroxidase 12-like [Tripterygium wilfordii]
MGCDNNIGVSLASFVLVSSLLLLSPILYVSEAQNYPPIVKGLSWDFYDSICPDVEHIIRNHLKKVFKENVGLAAALLRIHFHDCFVLGCEGSILLDGTAGETSEKLAAPNLNLRREAFKIVNDLRKLVHSRCGRVVSCADIVALAARDAVHLSKGPYYNIPLGRRDGVRIATSDEILADLPPPSFNTTLILITLAPKNFTTTDVVALSGAHTIGRSHCISIADRLFGSSIDPTMDPELAQHLLKLCPDLASINSTTAFMMDPRTPNTFDNKYYINLVNHQGLFTSDQDLYTDNRTRDLVTKFAANQTFFFEKFVEFMLKMGQLSVLTGDAGEIRANCSARNNETYFSTYPVVEGKKWATY